MGHFVRMRAPVAEAILLTGEQIDFLARKRGFEALAAWASGCMAKSPGQTYGYERRVVDDFLAGIPETRLLCRIQTDIEDAGKPALSTHAGTVFTEAVMEAFADLSGHLQSSPRSAALGGDGVSGGHARYVF